MTNDQVLCRAGKVLKAEGARRAGSREHHAAGTSEQQFKGVGERIAQGSGGRARQAEGAASLNPEVGPASMFEGGGRGWETGRRGACCHREAGARSEGLLSGLRLSTCKMGAQEVLRRETCPLPWA